MNDDRRSTLWEELKLVQGIINKFDEITFKIKTWFITIFVAVVGYAISEAKPWLLMLNFLLVAMFYLYEVTYRLPLMSFLCRSREIQKCLRDEGPAEYSFSSPNLDMHLLQAPEGELDPRCVRFFLNRGIDRHRAERNAIEWKELVKRSYTLLFQLRVSLIYIFAVLANMVALLVLLG